MFDDNPDNKVHGANMGPIWGRQDPGGPHVGPVNFAVWAVHLSAGITWSKIIDVACTFAVNDMEYKLGLNTIKAPIPCPNGQAMVSFCENCGENSPSYYGTIL